MFLRMIRGALWRQKSKMLMIAFTVALGTSLATAMLNIMLDVGDKVNRELKTYGANISVIPKSASLLDELYNVHESADAFLKEQDLGRIKTIFWAFNIVNFAPYLSVEARAGAGGEPVKVTGSWFKHHLELPTREEFDTGMREMKNWWRVEGQWLDDGDERQVMAGSALAERLNLKVGDEVQLSGSAASGTFRIKGIFESGSEEDEVFFATLKAAQDLGGLAGEVDSVEVSALTTPDNELSRRAARNPKSLSIKEMETWYCTAYVSSICYQIEEALPGAVARPIRQVAEAEGAILNKTQLLMLLITLLSILGSALGISNIVTAAVMERAPEIGLMKALGARPLAVTLLVLSEILLTACAGALAGYFAGILFAEVIGTSVFGAAIDIKTMVIPLVAVLVLVMTLLGSLPSIRLLLRLNPAEVLHGGR
ncbi:MAG: ABC transporter permease [Succinivibrio sp.]|nr:ABC transporter permease [Succinivibrio sp.]